MMLRTLPASALSVAAMAALAGCLGGPAPPAPEGGVAPTGAQGPLGGLPPLGAAPPSGGSGAPLAPASRGNATDDGSGATVVPPRAPEPPVGDSSGSHEMTLEEDRFRYAASVQDRRGLETFAWAVTTDGAAVHLDGSGKGSLTVLVRDAEGRLRFDQTFDGGAGWDTATTAGAPGNWRVELSFHGFSGTVQLRLDAR